MSADILARKDGRMLRDIPKVTSTVNQKMEPVLGIQRTTPAVQDGFPTILKCRWCGEKSREVYIPQLKEGKNGKPREIVYNYEPCAACKEKWASMVVIIEITEKEPYPDCLPIDKTVRTTDAYPEKDIEETVYFYPTGRHVGVTEAAAKEGIGEYAANGSIYYMEEEMFEDIFGDVFNK